VQILQVSNLLIHGSHGDGLGVCPEQELAGVGLCDDTTGKAVYTIPTVKYKVGQLTEYPVSATFW